MNLNMTNLKRAVRRGARWLRPQAGVQAREPLHVKEQLEVGEKKKQATTPINPADALKFDLSKMIFITGFARGGTSWLRDCLASHPDVTMIPREMPIFREFSGNRLGIQQCIAQAVQDHKVSGKFFVNKAPANAPFIGGVAKDLPEAKFLFIIRDPRDVFISHKRGTQKWMGGANSTVDGCMTKIESYYRGYLEARHLPNVHLVCYEALHQNFHETLTGVLNFLGLSSKPSIVHKSFKENNFLAVAGRHVENRDSAKRKGVVGDWVNFLSEKEADWYKQSPFWTKFMQQYEYSWQPVNYRGILTAMKEGGVKSVSEDDLLSLKLHTPGSSALLLHDIDLLQTASQRESVLETARIEKELGLASIFNFLPMDDWRYQPLKPAEVVDMIRQVQSINPRAAIGLHFNAAERFFTKEMPDADDEHPDMAQAISYLHSQVDEYEKHGIRFRTATAHGYGRRKKRPNNRDSNVFPGELKKRGIDLFDTSLRQQIDAKASRVVSITDVGEPLSVRDMPHGGSMDAASTYRKLPSATLVRFLTHPANYSILRPMTLGVRSNVASDSENE